MGTEEKSDKGKNTKKESAEDKEPATFDDSVASPAEFAKIPLDFIIASPLLTTIEAHKQAAITTLEFVNSIKNETMEFNYSEEVTDGNGNTTTQNKKINVPLIALTKVPSLSFDSLSVSFEYSISQVVTEKNATQKAAKAEIATKGILSKFVGASLSGSIENSKSRENVVNRGGTLDVKLHVSESALPAGLQKVIDATVAGLGIPVKKD